VLTLMRFLHAADLHIDSPLRGLEDLDEAPVDEIRSATRKALTRLVEVAHEQAVDFVILAGDIFDGDLRDVSTGRFFCAQMRALDPIQVFIVHGNHDSETEISKRVPPPSNVHTFKSTKAETRYLEDIKVAIHGRSYRSRVENEDLSASYPQPVSGYTNIGVLHTSLDGYAEHKTYAPCSRTALANFGYDYWALGHIHQREEVSKHPWVVFPGNIQGRHVRETGPKGCYLVEGDRDNLTASFVPLDSVRWYDFNLDVSAVSDPDAAVDVAVENCQALLETNDVPLICVRVTMTGTSPAHKSLMITKDIVAESIRSKVLPDIWLSELRIATTPPLDIDEEAKHDSIRGGLLRSIQRMKQEPSNEPRIVESLRPLKDKIPAFVQENYYTRLNDDATLRSMLDGAERVLLAELEG
jgi:DNA repair protein SbcD/Mre11